MFEKEMIKNKSGQVTIFILIGIIIVAASVLVYIFYPNIQSTLGIEESTPQTYIQSCVEDKLRETADLISIRGGKVIPELYSRYQGINIEYLCYTTDYYLPCIIQQPMLVQSIESEIRTELHQTALDCFDSLEASYAAKGYNVDMKTGSEIVRLTPNRIELIYNNTFTLTKGDDVQRYDSFVANLDNNIYELALVANSIIQWESTYGDADPEIYMVYYPNIKVERILRGSGDKIYTLTDREMKNEFWFAVRSQVWPGGYVNSTA